MPEISCDFCSGSYEKSTSKINENVKLGSKNFCSKECHKASKTTRVSGECLVCKNLVTRTKSQFEKTGKFFCSQSCAASYNNRGVRRNFNIEKDRTQKSCLMCKKTCNNKYCSITCSGEYQTAESLKKYLAMKQLLILKRAEI